MKQSFLYQEMSCREGHRYIQEIMQEMRKVIVGKDTVVLKVLLGFLAGGHILLEDMPGVGKTTLALGFARTLGLEYHRVQLTPDVLPSDITGFSMYHKHSDSFVFHPGVAFCNLLLADEINRTSSKTQSALLELMEEGAVTVDGQTHVLPKPYCVIATQNPVGSVGTQMLPESQLDRFMLCLNMGYPDLESEVDILRGGIGNNAIENVKQILDEQLLIAMQRLVAQIYVDDAILRYIAQLAAATRNHPMLRLGVSPRGSLALTAMVRATALARGRDYVVPDDVSVVIGDVFTHRMLLHPKARMEQLTADGILRQVCGSVPVPEVKGGAL